MVDRSEKWKSVHSASNLIGVYGFHIQCFGNHSKSFSFWEIIHLQVFFCYLGGLLHDDYISSSGIFTIVMTHLSNNNILFQDIMVYLAHGNLLPLKPVHAIQSLKTGTVLPTSETYLQNHSQATPHRHSTPWRTLYTLHCSSGISSATPRSRLTDASPGPASEPPSPGPWQTRPGHEISLSGLRDCWRGVSAGMRPFSG